MFMRGIWAIAVVLLLGTAPVQAADSSGLSPQTDSSQGDIDMYGYNIGNAGAVSTGTVTLTDVYTVGDSCEEGQLGRDADGAILTCESGVWAVAQSSGASFGGMYSTYTNNPLTGAKSCPSGYVAVGQTLGAVSDGTSEGGEDSNTYITASVCYKQTGSCITSSSSCPTGYATTGVTRSGLWITGYTCCPIN